MKRLFIVFTLFFMTSTGFAAEGRYACTNESIRGAGTYDVSLQNVEISERKKVPFLTVERKGGKVHISGYPSLVVDKVKNITAYYLNTDKKFVLDFSRRVIKLGIGKDRLTYYHCSRVD